MFPIVLIVFAAIFSLFVTEGPVYTVINFVGNSNIALFIAMLVTGYVLHPYMPEKTVMQYIDAMQTAPAMSCSSWVPVDASPPCWGQRP